MEERIVFPEGTLLTYNYVAHKWHKQNSDLYLPDFKGIALTTGPHGLPSIVAK